MPEFRVDVKGIDELKTKLKGLGKDIVDLLEEAVFDGSTVVVRAAQENSAKGGEFPHRITGNLFRSIPAVSPVVVSKTNTRVEMAVGSAAEYARRLERGFVGVDSRGRHYHQTPRPFLRPALDENQDEVVDAIRAKMAAAIARYTT